MHSKSFANKKLGLISIALFGLAAIAVQNTQADDEGPVTAVADIKGCTNPDISGSATLTEEVTSEGIKEVKITMFVEGLADGKHAVHIHENGECEPCGAAGGHHDPGNYGKTAPDAPDFNHPFHMGDLVNIKVNRGKGIMHTTTNRITLSPGRLSIFDDNGSAFIVHSLMDKYCDDENELVGGCAGGARDACGVISLNDDDD